MEVDMNIDLSFLKNTDINLDVVLRGFHQPKEVGYQCNCQCIGNFCDNCIPDDCSKACECI